MSVTVKEFTSTTLETVIAEMEGEQHSSRELSLAKTKAEEALFWYEQHLTGLRKLAGEIDCR